MLRVTNNDCTYTVRPGDSQADVCRSFGVSVNALRAVNPGMQWRGGARVMIPGHECLMPKRRGMGDYSALTLPLTAVGANDQVKVTVKCRYNSSPVAIASAVGQLTAFLIGKNYEVISVDANSVATSGTGWLYVLVRPRFLTNLSQIAQNVDYAVGYAGFGKIMGSDYITAEIYARGSGGTPTQTPVATPVINYGAIPNTPVNPGDQVKVQLQLTYNQTYVTSDGTMAARIANLLASRYQVIKVDTDAVSLFGGYISILVAATVPTTLANIAADCNAAASSVASINQSAGAIGASFYSRAAAGSPAPIAGVNANAVAPGSPTGGPAASSGGILDDISNALGLNTGLPATGLIVAVVAGVVLLVVLKT